MVSAFYYLGKPYKVLKAKEERSSWHVMYTFTICDSQLGIFHFMAENFDTFCMCGVTPSIFFLR